mmetsp:Transcript_13793/g.24435  ORF Transcript_13793/g.24435 Transcript_13793/m.24435 type:complete len:305 (-) Transcript_13793:10-924(-)
MTGVLMLSLQRQLYTNNQPTILERMTYVERMAACLAVCGHAYHSRWADMRQELAQPTYQHYFPTSWAQSQIPQLILQLADGHVRQNLPTGRHNLDLLHLQHRCGFHRSFPLHCCRFRWRWRHGFDNPVLHTHVSRLPRILHRHPIRIGCHIQNIVRPLLPLHALPLLIPRTLHNSVLVLHLPSRWDLDGCVPYMAFRPIHLACAQEGPGAQGGCRAHQIHLPPERDFPFDAEIDVHHSFSCRRRSLIITRCQYRSSSIDLVQRLSHHLVLPAVRHPTVSHHHLRTAVLCTHSQVVALLPLLPPF